jgi:nucleotide-binding universal stress UspA family protein
MPLPFRTFASVGSIATYSAKHRLPGRAGTLLRCGGIAPYGAAMGHAEVTAGGTKRALSMAPSLHRPVGHGGWEAANRHQGGIMGLKDVLVHVDNDPACVSRIDVAVALAAQHGAHLTGLHAMAWPRLPGYVELELPPNFLEEQQRMLEVLAREGEERFRERARRRGVDGEWRVDEGDVIAMTKLHARYADLTVVGQGRDITNAPYDLNFLPEELALGVGRPIVVVPRYGTFEKVGERILVAWNGSREATRAVHDALPLLQRASKVTILSINPESDSGPRVPSADIALHLARHGVAAEAASTPGLDMGVGDFLLSRAADLSVDLIVMGAYGHSRVREMVLGGVTRHMLQNMTVPVLMSH